MTDFRWTPEDAFFGYRTFWLEELRRTRLEQASLAELTRTLNDVRAYLIDRATWASKAWDIRTTQLILSEIDRAIGFWSQANVDQLVRTMEMAWSSGEGQSMGVFRAAGMQVGVAPFISRGMLEMATATAPILVSGIGRDLQTALGRELRQSVLAQEGPLQFVQRLGGPLPTVRALPGEPAIGSGPFEGMAAIRGMAGPGLHLPAIGHFPTAFHRAEAVYRTEIGRLSSMANQAALGQVAMLVPGMQKRWSALVDHRSRPAHAAAHGQVVGWDKPFTVAGEEMMYPRDPRASAWNTINCRCASLPWSDEWAQFGAKPPDAGTIRPWLSDAEYAAAQ